MRRASSTPSSSSTKRSPATRGRRRRRPRRPSVTFALARPLLCAAAIALVPASAAAQSKLLRFPDIHGDRVVFTHGGDLWMAPAAGGTAARLTSHPGLEL